jgi:ribonuclease P protein component
MGLIVPRFQSTAVARNRLRRRLEEIWRREIRPTQGEQDLLIRVRKDAYGARFSELRAELLQWVEGL